MPPQGERRLALVVRQEGKPQQVLGDFLHMVLNYQYGLSLVHASDMISAATRLKEHGGDLRCAFIIQNLEITSRVTITALSRGGQIPLFLLVPVRQLQAVKDLCFGMRNTFYWDWERGSSRRGPTLLKTVEAAFQQNRMGKLLDGIGELSYGDVRVKVAQQIGHMDMLPVLPELMLRIMKLVNEPEAEVDELEALLSSDPAIVWKLLEVMKSSTLAGTRKREWNMHDIIMRLGLKKVGAIAQQIVLMNALVKTGQSPFDMRRFWEHSVGSALIADKLVTTGSLPLQTPPKFSDYWLGTLLHDIGKSVLGLFFFSNFQQVLDNIKPDGDSCRDFREAEAKMGHVGLHEQVGQLLMLQVDAGPEIVEAVGNHHTGGEAPSPLTSLIHVADNICKDMGMGYLKEEKGVYSPEVLNDLGLEEKDLEGIRDTIEDSIVTEVRQIVSTCLAAEPHAEIAKTVPEPDRKESLRRLSELLVKIEAQLQADESLAAEQRKDLLTDVESLRSQLAKSAINPIIVQTLLQPLAEIDALGKLVSDMNVLLEKLS